MNTKYRLEKFRSLLDESGANAYIITNLLNIRYLTGFTGSAALLVVRSSGKSDNSTALLCSDGRYGEQARNEIANCGTELELFIGSAQQQLEQAVAFSVPASKVVIDPESTTLAEYEKWKELLETPPAFAKFRVESLRRFKDSDEIDLIRKASNIADAALERSLPRLLENPSELEFAAELDYNMRKLGAESPSFETIVASGINSAMPHARPTSKNIIEGDAVVIDFGATVDGYHSDCTRTYFIGDSPPKEFQNIYNAVEESQKEGCNQSALGNEISKVDAACRQILDSHALLEYFTHGTGHGVGLEIHELPWVSPSSKSILGKGDVITIEPGVYLGGKFGVRIEDTLAITESGTETLTRIAKSPDIA